MSEKYKPLSPQLLSENQACCGRKCRNCPFVPRFGGGELLDNMWLKFYEESGGEVDYEDYLTWLKMQEDASIETPS